jgi:hypothetical protein
MLRRQSSFIDLASPQNPEAARSLHILLNPQPRAPQLFIFAEVIAAKATNEAVASDFSLHAQRAILRLSQTVTFPHPYNYWGSVVNLPECLICLSKSGVAPAMFIAETHIVTFAANQSLRPISAFRSNPPAGSYGAAAGAVQATAS